MIAARFILGGQAPGPSVVHQVASNQATTDRYLTHVSTDKPIYRTGEKVYVRAFVLRAIGHTPMAGQGTATFEIKGPKGDTVISGMTTIIDSVAGFSWDIPASQAGGEYTVRIFHSPGMTAERKFDIRAYRPPRLKSQIVFVRDGYGPGDTVSATLHVERAEGGIPAGATVSVTARVDGEDTWRGETTIDGAGNAGATFKLPVAIARGEGVIAMVIQDGGTVETASKTIPILLQTMDLAIYPEGGDLIAGLPNRIYVEGRTPAKKPADLTGIIVNSKGKEVATFRTEHEGRGRFSFTPAKGEAYSLRVTEPAGIKTAFALPTVKESGVVISSVSDITPRQEDVVVRVGSTSGGVYGVTLTQRGKEFSFKRISLRPYQTSDVTFTLPKSLDGVIVATVYDGHNTPMAERLLFRQPDNNLKVAIIADRTDYVPGDKVTLRVTTTDETGKPVGAVVGLTVTDSSVLEMIEKREQAPSLPVMVLLEDDVQNLSDAHVYLDESNPKAPLATDLLLGTQGWRRFIHAGTGLITGVITDRTGAVLPGVTVQAMNTETGATLEGITNDRGAYSFPNVSAGIYDVSASLPGFRTETVAGLPVKFNSNLRQDIRLAVGAVNEMVELQAANKAVRANAAVPVVGQVLAENREKDLPLNGRDVRDFVEQRPGVQDDELLDADRGGFGGGIFRVRGDFARKEAVANILTTREYAHTLRPNWTAGSRADFAETVYWNAGVKTDASTGIATVSFNLSDSVTSFRVHGRWLSPTTARSVSVFSDVESVQPFSIEPKMPLQVTSGDLIQLPVSLSMA